MTYSAHKQSEKTTNKILNRVVPVSEKTSLWVYWVIFAMLCVSSTLICYY